MKREVITKSWPAMEWPVYGFKNGLREHVAWCPDYWSAVDLVNGSERNLYIGVSRYAQPPELDPTKAENWL